MELNIDDIEIEHNTAAQRYQARTDHGLAVAEYERNGDTITFTHTEVPPAARGRGIASKLIHVALEDARAEHLRVIPLCWFVVSYIRRHEEYASLLHQAYRRRL
ncbi:MAG TPA: GNAT family N-acetyltransferase [Roseiflexaceae bacterium]|nr:GNAT family N-acetyltransferase [Roseiflexaceae bacterium]